MKTISVDLYDLCVRNDSLWSIKALLLLYHILSIANISLCFPLEVCLIIAQLWHIPWESLTGNRVVRSRFTIMYRDRRTSPSTAPCLYSHKLFPKALAFLVGFSIWGSPPIGVCHKRFMGVGSGWDGAWGLYSYGSLYLPLYHTDTPL